jgi:hypothetical protein
MLQVPYMRVDLMLGNTVVPLFNFGGVWPAAFAVLLWS